MPAGGKKILHNNDVHIFNATDFWLNKSALI